MKICPNCGTQLSEETKFCVKCGTDVSRVKVEDKKIHVEPTSKVEQIENEGSQASSQGASSQQSKVQPAETTVQSSNFSQGAKTYWQWLVSTWKTPFKVQKTNKYFGLGTILGENIVFILSIYIIVNNTIHKVSDTANSFVDAVSGENSSTSYSNISPTFFFKTLIFMLLAVFLLAGAGYLSKRIFFVSSENFLAYLNRIVSYSNLNVIFNLVIFVFAFLSTSFAGVSLIFLMISLITTVWMIALYTSVLATDAPVKHDRVYGALVLSLASSLIIFVIAYLGGGALVSEITSMFGEFF